MDGDLEDAFWLATPSQVPVTVDRGGMLARGDECAAWVSYVRPYRIGVLFDVSVIATGSVQNRYAGRTIDMIGWKDDEPQNVRIEVAVDNRTLPTVAMERHWPTGGGPALRAFGGSSSSSSATSAWWVPLIPDQTLRITLEWEGAGLRGEVCLESASWKAQTSAIVAL